MPKVVFLNPWDRVIGPNRYLAEMLRHNPGLAENATVILNEENSARQEYEALGAAVEVWPQMAQIRASFSLGNFFLLLKNHTLGLIKTLAGLRRLRPDLIVTNTEQLLLGGLAARLLGIKHVKIFHAIIFSYRFSGRPRLRKCYVAATAMWCDRVIAVSDTLRAELVSAGLPKGKVVTVENPISPEAIEAEAKQPLSAKLQTALEDRGPVLVNAGRIAPLKGQDRLLDVLPAIKRAYPTVLCIFAGDMGLDSGFEDTQGYYENLMKRVQAEGLSENVAFPGQVDCLPALYQQCDLYVHASHTESFCRTAAEALICLTPVVAYEAGALSDTIGPGGVCVKGGDAEALTQAILNFLGDKEKGRKAAELGRVHVVSRFHADTVARKFKEKLFELAG